MYGIALNFANKCVYLYRYIQDVQEKYCLFFSERFLKFCDFSLNNIGLLFVVIENDENSSENELLSYMQKG